MLENLEIYKDVKRNEKCPCGSGLVFKKCCMKEYREAKKKIRSQKVMISTFSPLPPLSKTEKELFVNFYTNLMIFSYQYKNSSDVIVIEDISEKVQSFIAANRGYFYENKDEIIKAYIEQKSPTKDEMIILDGLKDARFEDFYLVSKGEENAIIMDTDEVLYNVKALNSPFTEIFKDIKYAIIKTALIPYKNCYITDGIYEGAKTTKEIDKYLDMLPFKQPETMFNKNSVMRNIEFAIVVALGCDVDKFKQMEEIVLKEIPDEFSKGVLKLFKNEYSVKEEIISSFLRASDFCELLDSEEGHQTLSFIFGGLPTTNYEMGNKSDVIPYEILKHYYDQPSLEESLGYEAYKKSFDSNAKRLFFMPKYVYTSFYVMLGLSHIDNIENIDRFQKFLEEFKTKEKREQLTVSLENLFEELSERKGFKIYPIFLDVCSDLNDITEEILNYRDCVEASNIHSIKKLKQYSIYKKL